MLGVRPGPRTSAMGLAVGFLLGICAVNSARAGYVGQYGAALCADRAHFNCVIPGKVVVEKEVKTKAGTKTVRRLADPRWEDMWPDAREREIVMKINRMNCPLRAGYRIAVPKQMAGKKLLDFSPFPKTIESPGERTLIFNPRLYAFAAYEADGTLLRWGPAVGGKGGYRTPAGTFRINSKGGPDCRSRIYPEGCKGRGCSPMPYCMEFQKGAAFHGGVLPGRHESHGCVRLFYDDAEWLSKNFVKVGVKVIVKPY